MDEFKKLTREQKSKEIAEMKKLLKSDLSKVEVEYIKVNYKIKEDKENEQEK